jgi:hypothetical protein
LPSLIGGPSFQFGCTSTRLPPHFPHLTRRWNKGTRCIIHCVNDGHCEKTHVLTLKQRHLLRFYSEREHVIHGVHRNPDHLRLVELQYIIEHPVNGELLIKVTKAGLAALTTRSDTSYVAHETRRPAWAT